jgi:hypothetical protein
MGSGYDVVDFDWNGIGSDVDDPSGECSCGVRRTILPALLAASVGLPRPAGARATNLITQTFDTVDALVPIRAVATATISWTPASTLGMKPSHYPPISTPRSRRNLNSLRAQQPTDWESVQVESLRSAVALHLARIGDAFLQASERRSLDATPKQRAPAVWPGRKVPCLVSRTKASA